MYGSAVCPFCPIVRMRLDALRPQMGFDFEYVDVTLKPGLVVSKGIKAGPVVEVGDRRIVGHASSEQLSHLVFEADHEVGHLPHFARAIT